ncbi:hypothetical protein BGZ58_010916 [Dissophora ornata]|nr:hypothetical protein BGZ58_010916 [Dissophora ornata]
MSSFAGFQGKVVQRGDEAYEESVYQYGWSSYETEGVIEPLAVIYAQDDGDVITAINYAKTNNVAVSVRTGGHQYCGASSTNDNNIQLDLSQTYTDFQWENADHSQVTLGISIPLGKFQSKLRAQRRFVPTGQCSYVHLGGHVQTGGYGQLIRSFGLLADYVQKVRIITADGVKRWVERGVAADKELLYAILGGSPGNFGVITDVTLNVQKDEDHALSRGFRAQFPYTEARLKALLDVMVAQDDKPDTPGDYDYCITVMGARPAEGKPATGIVVFAQWANLEGPGQVYHPDLFNKIRAAGGGKGRMTPVGSPNDGIFIDDEPTPMSELCSHWLFPIAREFQVPYHKRTYMSNSNSMTLKANNWTEWVSGRIEELVAGSPNECFVSAQFQYCGGTNSRFITHGMEGITSLSWRDSSFGCTLDAFYDTKTAGPYQTSLAWVQKNDIDGVGHAGAKFSVQDRRVLWGSYDLDLVAARAFYYDQWPEKYDRLCRTKLQYDPDHVFTPNKFCIGPLPPRAHVDVRKSGSKYAFSNALKSADVRSCAAGHC